VQSKDGSLALTKNDLIFLLVSKDSIGEGNGLLLKQLSCWSEGQYLLIIFITLDDDDGVYLVKWRRKQYNMENIKKNIRRKI